MDWYKSLLTRKKFLYGEKVKYSFQTPRKEDYLKGAKVLNDDDTIPFVMSKDTHFLIKGPFDLEIPDELERVLFFNSTIEKLKKIKVFTNDTYKDANLVIESSTSPNKLWIMYGYGGDDYVSNLYKRYNNYRDDKHFCSPESTSRILILIILKIALGVADATNFKRIINPTGSIKIVGLDQKEKTINNLEELFVPVKSSIKQWDKFLKLLSENSDICIEAIDLYSMRIEKSFSPDDEFSIRWKDITYFIKNKIFPNSTASNPLCFGWPMNRGDRIMFKYQNKLLPGTILENEKSHSKIDYSCFAYRYRKIRPDDCGRKDIHFTQSHCDLDVLSNNVRPMTPEESDMFVSTDSDLKIIRNGRYTNYFLGDIVKVFNSVVNDEIDRMGSIEKKIDTVKILGKPNDIGLVVTDGSDNPYWRDVYCWKTKKITSFRTASLYWVSHPETGRALRIENAESRLEEDAPLKILRDYKPLFEKWL
jgi:hypothetical protein